MLSRKRRRNVDEPPTSVKLKSFVPLNSSFFWTGYNMSIFCSELATRLQQKASKATFRDSLESQRGLRNIKRLETLVSYKNVQDTLPLGKSVVVFSDAGRNHKNAQICYTTGPLLDKVKQGFIFIC